MATARTNWLNPTEMRAWRSWIVASGRLAHELDRELQDAHDLSLGEYEVLVVLSETKGGRMRMAELAELTSISRSLLSHRFSRLANRKFVERTSCPEDGRGAFASVTPAGRKALTAAAPTHVAGVRRWFLDNIAPESLDMLRETLERMVKSLGGPQGFLSDESSTSKCGQPKRP